MIVPIFFILIINQVNASMLDWFWHQKSDPNKILLSDNLPLVSIPYESLTQDEQFLKEAAKLETGIQLSSPLEVCQHKVILKIKTSCSSMSEEQLAKLSVNLLNCQSAIEGREIFPCSEDMTIKQCTTKMDANMWNAYHLMSNRARAVCYAARSLEFRSLTELTVNKLMQSAHSQIESLNSLKESHDRLEEQTVEARNLITSNIQNLNDEKALIRSGHKKLAEMTEDIRQKLENASQDFQQHNLEHKEHFAEILEDLSKVTDHISLLWEKMENSTNRIINQNEEASIRYVETLSKLEKINSTIFFIWNITDIMHTEINEKLGWIADYIDTTGESLHKFYKVVSHITYILAAMLIATFLHAPLLTRFSIIGIIPINLGVFLRHGNEAALDFASITFLILLITGMHFLMNGVENLLLRNSLTNDKKKNYNKKRLSYENSSTKEASPLSQIDNAHQSFFSNIINNFFKIFQFIKQKIYQYKDNIENFFTTSEKEFSCSFSSSKKRHRESIITSSSHPKNRNNLINYTGGSDLISDDSFLNPMQKISEDEILPQKSSFFKTFSNSKSSSKLMGSSLNSTPINQKIICSAKTRSGNPCRLFRFRNNDYCHIHVSNTSITTN